MIDMAWQRNGTPHTLGGTATNLTISSMNAKKFNQFLSHMLKSGILVARTIKNNNTNSVYAFRTSANGSESTSISQSNVGISDSDSLDAFVVEYCISVTGEEKLSIIFYVGQGASGAGTAPTRREIVAKFVPSPDTGITRVDNTVSTSTFAASSNLSALGSD